MSGARHTVDLDAMAEVVAAMGQAHQEWVRGAQEMATALRALRAVTNTAHGNYTRPVETNVRMWP